MRSIQELLVHCANAGIRLSVTTKTGKTYPEMVPVIKDADSKIVQFDYKRVLPGNKEVRNLLYISIDSIESVIV